MNDTPQVKPTTARSWDGVWLLTVRCPFCTKLHTHGGGDGDAPARFGGRISHCKTGDQGVYEIVDPAAASNEEGRK
ncbi:MULTISPECIES: hypothetical protein [unclassified Streptomyces]|uniref:hypothetical protein n=1 Tax=unclassified Streptomyces TaxID=2593676 RepID=UPI003D91DF3E